MIYKSKISPVIWLPFGTTITIVSLICILGHDWDAFIIIGIVVAFVVHMIATTYYAINGNTLKVHSSFIVNVDIDITSIKSISETNSVMSAPALSFDRIEIAYNKYDSIVISPPNKTDFIAHLQSLNPAIEVKPKQKN